MAGRGSPLSRSGCKYRVLESVSERYRLISFHLVPREKIIREGEWRGGGGRGGGQAQGALRCARREAVNPWIHYDEMESRRVA